MQHPECDDCRHELCESCRSPEVTHYDVEGVPFCEKCWNDATLWGADSITPPDQQGIVV